MFVEQISEVLATTLCQYLLLSKAAALSEIVELVDEFNL